MAKKKIEAAEIIIKTTDGGSFKITGKEAEKLTKKMKGLGGASQETDRRIKGVTQQSSNATKNFSKQAQTMQGGIVAVYATIAAQVFAVSAAFQFLKSSMETRNLIEGQKAFGSVTGTAYKTLTTNIQEATKGMLGFKEAASAGAIGVAAGLSATQLGKLGTAATNASLALGRDLTDSFNRLIRGVTKAEPELLDELGIILRLENATNKYAVSVGKTREQLNAYERTQAVLNDVLEQASTKYGMIQEKMDPDAFAMGQFTKEMDDMVLAFQEVVIKGLLPFLKFFKENSTALVAAVGLFVLPIIKSLLPDLNQAMKDSADRSTKAARVMKKSFRQAGDAATDAFSSLRGGGLSADESEAYLKKKGVKTGAQGDTGAVLTKRQIAAYRRNEEKKLGIWRNMRRKERAEFRQHLNQQEAMLNRSTIKQVNIVRFGDKSIRAIKKATAASVAASYAFMSRAASLAASAMNKAFMAAGVIGLIAMLVQGLVSLYNWFRDLDPTMKKMRQETERLAEAHETLNEELGRMVNVRTTDYLLDLKGAVEQTGNALQSAGIRQQIADYNQQLQRGQDVSGFVEMAENLSILAPEMGGLFEEMSKGNAITNEQAVAFENLASGYINASQAAKNFSQSQQALNKELDKQVRKFMKLPFQDLMTASTGYTAGLKSELGIIDPKTFKGDTVTRDGVQYDKFGLIGQAQERDKARAKRLKEIEEGKGLPVGTRRKSFRYNDPGAGGSLGLTKGADFSFYNADGSFKTPEQFAKSIITGDHEPGLVKGLDTSSRAGSGFEEGSSVYEKAMKAFNREKTFQDEKQKILDEGKEDEKQQLYKLELLRQQEALETRMTKLQDDTIEFSATQLTNKENLVKHLGKEEIKQADILATKKKQLTDTENMANLETQAAELAHASNLEKAKGALLAYEIPGTEQLKYTKEQIMALDEEGIKDLLTKNDLSTQALEASTLGVNNAQAEERILKEQNKLKKRQLELEERLLGYSDKRADLLRQQKIDTMTIAQAQIAMANAMRTSSDPFALYGTQRTAKIGNLDTQIGTQQSMLTNTQSALTKTGAKGTVGADGFYSGAHLTLEQKEYNRLKMEELNIENALAKLRGQKQVLLDEESGATMQGALDKKQKELEFEREKVYSLNPATAQFNALMLEAKQKNIVLDDKKKQQLMEQAIEMEALKIETELMDGVTQTLSNGFVSMFQAMVDGSKSFKDSMKDLTKSVLTDLAAMFAKAAALKIMLAMFPGMGGMLDGIKEIPGMGRYGGEMTKYRGGGVADGPNSGYMAMLHGREAVVPLGNDRSIPVDMRGMPAAGNTVTVNISMNGQGQGSSQVTGDGMQGLGRSIGNMVQQHLQQEMRPGGLLNQQGTKGRT